MMRASSAASPRARPNLFLAGFPKCATTSLFTWLDQHPDIAGSRDKEPRWFYPVLHGQPLPDDDDVYLAQWNEEAAPLRYRLDGSPALVYGGAPMISALQMVAAPEKIVVLLRDPVARFRGGYRFLRSRLLLSDDIDYATFIERSLANFHPGSPRPEHGGGEHQLSESCFSEYLPPWVETFGADLYVTFAENLRADPVGAQDRLHTWLGLSPRGASISVDDQNLSVAFRSSVLHRAVLRAHESLRPVWRRAPGAKAVLRGAYASLNRGADVVAPDDDGLDDVVASVLAPYSRRLPDVLDAASIDVVRPAWFTALGASGEARLAGESGAAPAAWGQP